MVTHINHIEHYKFHETTLPMEIVLNLQLQMLGQSSSKPHELNILLNLRT